MNTKLFRDILALVNKQFQKDKYITEDEFIYYLLGYKDTNNTNDKHNKFLLDLKDDLSDCLKGKNTLHAVLGGQYSTILSQSHHFKLDDLIKISLGKDSKAVQEVIDNLYNSSERISSLYNQYSLPLSQQEDVRDLLINLFTVCITEKKPYLFASQKKKQLKPSTFNKIYGRADDSRNLFEALNKFHKIILTDQPGTGKSYFIKYCLSFWKLSDYCYIDYFYDLKTTKQKIEYYKDKKDLLFKTSEDDLFDKDFSSALLVIDHVNFSEKLSDELGELATYAINVIIVTTANISHSSFYSFILSTLSDDTLQSIFEINTGISVNNLILERLFCISQRNVLLITLLAGQYKQIARNADNSSIILDNLLQNLGNSSIVHLNIAHGNTLTFKHQYDKEALDIIGHIKSIYAKFAAKYDKTDDLRIIMRFLCCLGYSPISILFLEELFAYDHDTLDIHLTNLYDMGLIQKNDLTIQLSSIMARSVFAFEIPSYTDCDEQIDKLSTFLQKYDQTLLYPYLSDTLLIFAQSIYPKVREKNNPNQKHATEKFENWQNLIYLIFNYYNQMGDFYIAEKISAIIKYPALISRHSSWDAYIFWLGNNIQSQNLIDVMPNLLDQVNDHISQYAGPSRIIDISSLLMNTLDLIIGLYCVFFFNNYFCNNYVDYMNTLVSTMKVLLKYMNPNNDCFLSAEKAAYYKSCFKIISNPAPTFDDFEKYLSKVKCFENKNYRIRGTAFILFLQSLCIHGLYINRSKIDCDPVLFLKTFISELRLLSELICGCKLIPVHTFRLCTLTYITSAILQQSLTIIEPDKQISFITIDDMRELVNRSILSKEDVSILVDKLNTFFNLQ